MVEATIAACVKADRDDILAKARQWMQEMTVIASPGDGSWQPSVTTAISLADLAALIEGR